MIPPVRAVLTVADLADAEVVQVLARAAAHHRGDAGCSGPAGIVGTYFAESSLRTRIGFGAAAYRLGWNVLEVTGRRASESSMPESWQDTVRVLSGYADCLVARPGRPLGHGELAQFATVPFLNGGNTGPRAEHPSQALIDLFAMEQLAGPVTGLRVAVCGDLRSRSARSLLALLDRFPPAELQLVTAGALHDPEHLPVGLRAAPVYHELAGIGDVDVLYAVGIPHGSVPEGVRSRLRVDRAVLSRLPDSAVVLSPMPVIDEISHNVRGEARIQMYRQSDLGLFVRMALLELMLGRLS